MLKGLRRILRLIQINFILARHGLDRLVLSLHLFAPLRFLIYLNPWNWLRSPHISHGESLRCALEELGPIFVKFGQALSTRRDLLPADIGDELAKLQDSVPSFPGTEAMDLIRKAYGKTTTELFATFEEQPLASASIAQVHAATLDDGREVVVKVLRPKVDKMIQRDIDLLYVIARLAEKYIKESRRLRPVEIVAEFEKSLGEELDLQREAANASLLRRNFAESKILYIPEIYWPYVHKNILVMERIHGIPVTDVEELRKRNFNIKKLAERGVEIFFTQVFRDSFFHADMHPGNIFVSYQTPEDPQYIAVDFGNAGSLSIQDQRYLAENFLAFFNRDYRRIAELHLESGWIPADTRLNEFEAAIRTVCEPIFERPLSELSFAQMLMRLFQTGRHFNMEVQPQLVLLQKTLFAVEGLGRQLYPELDLWSTAKPFLEDWMQQQLGPKTFFDKIAKELPLWTRQMPEVPALIYDVLTATKQHVAQLSLQQKQDSKQKIRRSSFCLRDFLLGATITLLVATYLYIL